MLLNLEFLFLFYVTAKIKLSFERFQEWCYMKCFACNIFIFNWRTYPQAKCLGVFYFYWHRDAVRTVFTIPAGKF
jgi:hypothetical protein